MRAQGPEAGETPTRVDKCPAHHFLHTFVFVALHIHFSSALPKQHVTRSGRQAEESGQSRPTDHPYAVATIRTRHCGYLCASDAPCCTSQRCGKGPRRDKRCGLFCAVLCSGCVTLPPPACLRPGVTTPFVACALGSSPCRGRGGRGCVRPRCRGILRPESALTPQTRPYTFR
jgi:hypothetical protein